MVQGGMPPADALVRLRQNYNKPHDIWREDNMVIETDNTNREDTDNSDGRNNTDPTEQDSDVTSDPILSKHLDIAIEAQDGKPKAKDTSN
jgi:hypothetical protein